MKLYALCDETKRCKMCGGALRYLRKNAVWYYENKEYSLSRPTNIFFCDICRKDYVMEGDHIDESGWEKLILPIDNHPQRHVRPSYTKASPVTVYYEPQIVKAHLQAKERQLKKQEQQKEQQIDRMKESANREKKKQIGIHQTKHETRNCGTCEFYFRPFCNIHVVATSHQEICHRYKHYFKREIPSGLPQ